MNDKDSITIRLLTIPWVTHTKRSFRINNIGHHGSFEIKKDTVLFVGKAIFHHGKTRRGHLVFNVLKDIYCFWPEENNNIHEYLTMMGRSSSWREDISLLQGKKEDFTLEIGPKG